MTVKASGFEALIGTPVQPAIQQARRGAQMSVEFGV